MTLQVVLGLVAFVASIHYGRKAGSARYSNERHMALSFVFILVPTYMLIDTFIDAQLWKYFPPFLFLYVIATGMLFCTPWFSRDAARTAIQQAAEETERKRIEKARAARLGIDHY